MHVDVDVPVELLAQPQVLRARADVAQRGLRRLLHHFAKLPRRGQLALAVQHLHLGLQNRSADLGPRQAGDQPNLALLVHLRVAELRHAQQFAQVLAGQHLAMFRPALHHLARHLAAHVADLALQVAYAGLARVAADHRLAVRRL